MDENEVMNNGTEASGAENLDAKDTESNETIESLKAALAEERAQRKREKQALDKSLKQVGDLTKQLRAKQTEDEIAAEEKQAAEEERNEYVAGLEAYKRENEAKERYLLQGMSADLAKKAAAAEVAGDMDALADIQKQHTEAVRKADRAEWMKSRPDARVGDGSYPEMTKEEIMAIEDYDERIKAIATHPHLF